MRARSQAAAELALATAGAYERADAELITLLDRHPDLAGYVSGPRPKPAFLRATPRR